MNQPDWRQPQHVETLAAFDTAETATPPPIRSGAAPVPGCRPVRQHPGRQAQDRVPAGPLHPARWPSGQPPTRHRQIGSDSRVDDGRGEGLAEAVTAAALTGRGIR